MDTQTVVLVATPSISLADGLDALLKAIPRVEEVVIARSPESALQSLELRKPRILLLDTALVGDQPAALLEQIRSLSAETQRVLLADDVRDGKWTPRYAEAILIKGGPPSSIARLVTNLLLSKGEEHEHND